MKSSLAAIVIGAIAVISFAQPDKDLVGTWKMDAAQSKFADAAAAPTNVLIRFERQGDLLRETLSVRGRKGDSTRTLNYALDGRELVNGSGDDRITSKIKLSSHAIALEWIDEGGTYTRNISLSPDRKTMTIAVHDSNPDGESDHVIVLQRQ